MVLGRQEEERSSGSGGLAMEHACAQLREDSALILSLHYWLNQ
jgi:hypothetical protein